MLRNIFALLLLLSLTGCLSPRNNPVFRRMANASDERIAKQTEEELKKSPILQEINRLCTEQVPIFNGFRQVRRLSWQSENPFLSYSYESSADVQTVRVFYKDYFSRNGWDLRHDQMGGWGPAWHATWRKSGYSISIEKTTTDDYVYGLFCQKLLFPEKALY
jgi:hypothetical protein